MAADRLDEALNEAARQAEKEIRELMEAGARDYEAREIVLPQLILLPPEKKGTGSKAQDDELAELEREYREAMR